MNTASNFFGRLTDAMLLGCRACGSETWSPMLPRQSYIPDQGRRRARGTQRGNLRGVRQKKGWLEARFQCHLWKAFPDGDAGEFAEEREAEEDAAAEESSEVSEDKKQRRRRRLPLRDADGMYYVGDAAKVHEFLGVEHYVEMMPRIPLEELHTSSVQHPRYPAH